jgi:hypothetical protein
MTCHTPGYGGRLDFSGLEVILRSDVRFSFETYWCLPPSNRKASDQVRFCLKGL